MKDICKKKKIEKMLYKYGLHQYLRKAQQDLHSLCKWRSAQITKHELYILFIMKKYIEKIVSGNNFIIFLTSTIISASPIA